MNIQKILDAHKKWLNNEGGCRADLRYAFLKGVDLSCHDLSYADLSHADLRGADLRNTSLYRANLTRVNMRNANLEGADLVGAIFYDSDLKNVNLKSADISTADMRYADLRYACIDVVDMNGTVGNNAEIKSLFMLDSYPVVYTHKYLQIGCEKHSINRWRKFSDCRIARMDVDALEWWKENKDLIMQIITSRPAKPTFYK